MKKRNISFSLTIYLLLSEILIVTVIMVMGYRFTHSLIYDNILYRVKLQASATVGPISASMAETKKVIDVVAAEIEKSANASQSAKLLQLAIKVNPEIFSISYLMREEADSRKLKSLFYYSREEESIRQTHLERIFEHWLWDRYNKMESGWSDPVLDTLSGHHVIQYAKPVIYSNRGKIRSGIIQCSISLDEVQENLEKMRIQKTGFPILLTQGGIVVYHPFSKFLGSKVENLFSCLDENNLHLKDIVQKRRTGIQTIQPLCFNNKKAVAIFWPIDSINWSIVLVVPHAEFYNELNRITSLIILIILFVGSVTAALTIYFSIRLVSPINILVDDSRKLLEEVGINYPQKRNEIEILSESIELMKYNLDNYKRDSMRKSVDRAEMDRELNLAKDIEMGMVPTQFPLYPGRTDFDCYGKLIPAKTVGGDLFDIFLIDNNTLFVSICDTLGKGIPAAMFSVVTRTLIRSLANPITRLGKIMEQLNEELSFDGKSEMFVTVFLAKIDLKTGELTYCNAGHPHPFVARKNKMVDELDVTHGIPVGVRVKQSFKETSLYLNNGDSLVAYTDGITEEIDEIGEFYGTQRLVSVIRLFAEESCERLVDEILNSVDQFKSKSDATDDTTLLAVKYLGKSINPMD